MRQSFILSVILFVSLSVLRAENVSKCIIIGSARQYEAVVDSLSAAFQRADIEVETYCVSARGIAYTADSLSRVVGAEGVGIVGLGLTGGVVAANICKANPSISWLVMISTLGVSGKRFEERFMVAPTYILDVPDSVVMASGLRKQLRERKAEEGDMISIELRRYNPEELLGSICCPVFALTGVNDARLDWYENLSAMERYIPYSYQNKFKAYPFTGYMLLEEREYVPVWLGDASRSVVNNVNSQAINDVIDWIDETTNSQR